MARRGGGRSRGFRSVALDLLDSMTLLGIRIGGAAFILAFGYLMWGFFSGTLDHIGVLAAADQKRVWANLILANKVLGISGPALCIALAIRYYAEEVVGYLLLLAGAMFYWGLPAVADSVFLHATKGSATMIVYSIGRFQSVAALALACSVPLILFDLWQKLLLTRRSVVRRGSAEKLKKASANLYHTACWQMPYCRDYLKKFCSANSRKKTCWRIKSGCYCDENLILRAIKGSSNSDHWEFDQKFSASATPAKILTAAQKRERCRRCTIYTEHQKQKYRLLSPLPFIAVVALMYNYSALIHVMLNNALTGIDKLAARFSFLPKQAGHEIILISPQQTGSIAEWLLLVCIGLVAVTYLLKALEYVVFELQL